MAYVPYAHTARGIRGDEDASYTQTSVEAKRQALHVSQTMGSILKGVTEFPSADTSG